MLMPIIYEVKANDNNPEGYWVVIVGHCSLDHYDPEWMYCRPNDPEELPKDRTYTFDINIQEERHIFHRWEYVEAFMSRWWTMRATRYLLDND